MRRNRKDEEIWIPQWMGLINHLTHGSLEDGRLFYMKDYLSMKLKEILSIPFSRMILYIFSIIIIPMILGTLAGHYVLGFTYEESLLQSQKIIAILCGFLLIITYTIVITLLFPDKYFVLTDSRLLKSSRNGILEYPLDEIEMVFAYEYKLSTYSKGKVEYWMELKTKDAVPSEYHFEIRKSQCQNVMNTFDRYFRSKNIPFYQRYPDWWPKMRIPMPFNDEKKAECIQYYYDQILNNPDDFIPMCQLSWWYLYMGRDKESIQWAMDAIECETKDAYSLYKKIELMEIILDMNDEALELSRIAVKEFPDHGGIYLSYARALVRNYQNDEALEMINRGIKKLSEPGSEYWHHRKVLSNLKDNHGENCDCNICAPFRDPKRKEYRWNAFKMENKYHYYSESMYFRAIILDKMQRREEAIASLEGNKEILKLFMD